MTHGTQWIDAAVFRSDVRKRAVKTVAPRSQIAGPVRIVGIDPGTRVVGVGVIDIDDRDRATFVACEAISPRKTAAVGERLLVIHDRLEALLLAHKPSVVVIEKVFVGKSSTSAIRIGEARGVALVCAARAGAEVFDVTPATVKRSIAGFGAAEKRQVSEWIARLLGLREPPQPFDAADALAIAMTHVYGRRANLLGIHNR
ncbi:MAG: crossover junction endodeoxyribonuclease RuvC [Planctomycetes bacterium]|nr:crossover junction endodeoxyribonuclease RuvC [Planctomycetota bacterium]